MIFGDVHFNYDNVLSNDTDYDNSPEVKKVTYFDLKAQKSHLSRQMALFSKAVNT